MPASDAAAPSSKVRLIASTAFRSGSILRAWRSDGRRQRGRPASVGSTPGGTGSPLDGGMSSAVSMASNGAAAAAASTGSGAGGSPSRRRRPNTTNAAQTTADPPVVTRIVVDRNSSSGKPPPMPSKSLAFGAAAGWKPPPVPVVAARSGTWNPMSSRLSSPGTLGGPELAAASTEPAGWGPAFSAADSDLSAHSLRRPGGATGAPSAGAASLGASCGVVVGASAGAASAEPPGALSPEPGPDSAGAVGAAGTVELSPDVPGPLPVPAPAAPPAGFVPPDPVPLDVPPLADPEPLPVDPDLTMRTSPAGRRRLAPSAARAVNAIRWTPTDSRLEATNHTARPSWRLDVGAAMDRGRPSISTSTSIGDAPLRSAYATENRIVVWARASRGVTTASRSRLDPSWASAGPARAASMSNAAAMTDSHGRTRRHAGARCTVGTNDFLRPGRG